VRNPATPIGGDLNFLDSSSGVGMPFWDDGCHILYIAGKGDGNIRYYEYENDKFEYLSEYKSPEPQRGLAFMPKRGVNTHENEVMRAFKTVNDTYVEPISFIVPRRSENFQEDIYPPTVGTKPAMSSAEWLGGNTALPPQWSMEDLYDGKAPTELAAPAAPKPTTTKTAPEPEPLPAPTPAKAPEPKPEPTPSVARTAPSMETNKKSMADMADRFADKDAPEENDDDDSSSFEEVQKPVERPTAKTTTESAPSPQPAAAVSRREPVSEPPKATSPPVEDAKKDEPASTSAAAPTASSAAGGLRDVLQEIRGMIQSQGKQIEQLTNEVAQLKAKVGE
jgi:coronin-1B/1C/6